MGNDKFTKRNLEYSTQENYVHTKHIPIVKIEKN